MEVYSWEHQPVSMAMLVITRGFFSGLLYPIIAMTWQSFQGIPGFRKKGWLADVNFGWFPYHFHWESSHPPKKSMVSGGCLKQGRDYIPISLWCLEGLGHIPSGYLTNSSPWKITTHAIKFGKPSISIWAINKPWLC